ncbi:MAG: hypothetical protein LBN27_03710 [Prevotellaceae bacterium]|jgi:hypothetical protein|nr:hypothetical protein [Prevotellaceae bacterium]
MGKYNTLTEIRIRKQMIHSDITDCENVILEKCYTAVTPSRWFGKRSDDTQHTVADTIQQIRNITSIASTAMSVFSIVRGLKKIKK